MAVQIRPGPVFPGLLVSPFYSGAVDSNIIHHGFHKEVRAWHEAKTHAPVTALSSGGGYGSTMEPILDKVTPGDFRMG